MKKVTESWLCRARVNEGFNSLLVLVVSDTISTSYSSDDDVDVSDFLFNLYTVLTTLNYLKFRKIKLISSLH